jgi:drug/metabolite transporter (DMT)-like permease
MNLVKKNIIYHILTLITIIIWGTTLVSTKVLLQHGLSPAEIMIIRFITAYLFLWILYPKTHKIHSVRDELIFLFMGITGCSLYFLLENSALIYTYATNAAIIGALIPLLTAVLSCLVLRTGRLNKYFWIGSFISITGAVIVILNGKFSFQLNSFGDFLAFSGIVSWCVYCVLSKCLKGNYASLFITRKMFFYGTLTILPYFFFFPFDVPIEALTEPTVLLNLCFLGFIASSLCFFAWTLSLKNLGVVTTNNYIYFGPVITIVTAHFVLDEKITFYVLMGVVLLFLGLWIATNRKKINFASR